MKVDEIKSGEFKPLEVTITIETLDELETLKAALGSVSGCIEFYNWLTNKVEVYQ